MEYITFSQHLLLLIKRKMVSISQTWNQNVSSTRVNDLTQQKKKKQQQFVILQFSSLANHLADDNNRPFVSSNNLYFVHISTDAFFEMNVMKRFLLPCLFLLVYKYHSSDLMFILLLRSKLWKCSYIVKNKNSLHLVINKSNQINSINCKLLPI